MFWLQGFFAIIVSKTASDNLSHSLLFFIIIFLRIYLESISLLAIGSQSVLGACHMLPPILPYHNEQTKTQTKRTGGYSYADIISVRPDLLPGYETKIKAFFEEHIHDAEEIRYILDGSGYFDIRDKEDKWIRIWIKKGDLMTLPEGCYHRFTCDETDYIQAMRLFIGQPVWTPFNRPQEDHKSRKYYVDTYMKDEEKKEAA